MYCSFDWNMLGCGKCWKYYRGFHVRSGQIVQKIRGFHVERERDYREKGLESRSRFTFNELCRKTWKIFITGKRPLVQIGTIYMPETQMLTVKTIALVTLRLNSNCQLRSYSSASFNLIFQVSQAVLRIRLFTESSTQTYFSRRVNTLRIQKPCQIGLALDVCKSNLDVNDCLI